MEQKTSLADADFALGTTYLNTASAGIGPAASAAAMRRTVDAWASDRIPHEEYEAATAAARGSFARLAGTTPERVAVGSTVSSHVGMIAAALPAGSEILVSAGDFSSLVNPFTVRPDLTLRSVPLASLADAVRPATALVAVSSVQSSDGRVADLPAVRAAAAAHGARTLLDTTQSTGWLPLTADDWDYTVCGAFKWLLCPRGVSFLTVRESAMDGVSAIGSGWYAAEDPWMSCYGPIAELAASARRFDVVPAYLVYIAAARSLALLEELTVPVIHAHDTALANRFRAGLAALGHPVVPAGADDSAIVGVPGLGTAVARLSAAGVQVSARAGNLRAAFHLYNSTADVDHALEAVGPAL